MNVSLINQICEELLAEQLLPADLVKPQISQRIRSKHNLGPEDLGIIKATLTARIRFQKFNEFSHFVCTQQSIEQASSIILSTYHAEHFSGNDKVLEIGSGAGVDSLAIIKNADSILSLEVNSTTAQCARHNLSLWESKSVEVIEQDARQFCSENSLDQFTALWADPSRRDKNGKRILNPSHYSPPLDFLIDLPISKKGIKISSIADVNLPTGWVREWIGFDKECKEQILWYGMNKETDAVVIIEDDHRYIWKVEETSSEKDPEELPENGDLTGHWLIEPHAAILATRKEREFLSTFKAKCFEDDVVYGITKVLPSDMPLYTRFKLSTWMPYNKKGVKEKIHSLNWNSNTEIKKRNFPYDIDTVKKDLKLPASNKSNASGVVFLSRYRKLPIVILGQRMH